MLMSKTSSLFLVVVLVLMLLGAGCNQQPAPAQQQTQVKRIISLSPHVTEILYALGQQDKLVAVTDYCSYPPQASKKPHIGGLLNPNIERIILLKPDVLIGVPAHQALAEKLKKQGLTTVLLPNDQLTDVFFTIDSLGRLLNCEKQAKALIRTLKDSLSHYQRLAHSLNPENRRAVLVIGREPGTVRHITVVGPHTFLDSVWTLVGGKNVFNDLPVAYTQVGQEALLTKQPDIIIELRINEQWDSQKELQNFREWQPLFEVRAVQKRNIFVLTENYTLIPGPRLYLLAKDFYHILRNANDQ